MTLTGRRPRGRPKRRLMDVVRENLKVVGETEEEEDERGRRWRQLIPCIGPWRKTVKAEEGQ